MLVAVLVLLGLGMIVLALWLVRSTRSDPQVLGPLEVMGDRRWRKGDADRRQRDLDTARPAGAWPPAPMVAFVSVDGDTAGAGTDPSAADAEAADTVGERAPVADGDAGVESSDGAATDAEAAEAAVDEPATVGDGDAGDEDSSDGAAPEETVDEPPTVADGDGAAAEGAAPEESVGEPPTADGDGEEDTSDGAVASADDSEDDDAAPLMEESTISSPAAENAPADERTAVEVDKKE